MAPLREGAERDTRSSVERAAHPKRDVFSTTCDRGATDGSSQRVAPIDGASGASMGGVLADAISHEAVTAAPRRDTGPSRDTSAGVSREERTGRSEQDPPATHGAARQPSCNAQNARTEPSPGFPFLLTVVGWERDPQRAISADLEALCHLHPALGGLGTELSVRDPHADASARWSLHGSESRIGTGETWRIVPALQRAYEEKLPTSDSILAAQRGARSVSLFRGVPSVSDRSLIASRLAYKIAGEIQRNLLPRAVQIPDGVDVAGLSCPAEEIGGDYFDVIGMPGGCTGLVIGDATGHGIPPAILMAQARSSLWSLALTGCGVEEILRTTNAVLHAGAPPNYYVTLGFTLYDPQSATLRYAGCGHPPGYLLDRTGDLKARLVSTGFPLGAFPSCGVRLSDPVRLDRGDLLLLLTDGAAEAVSGEGDPFGERRVLSVVRENLREPASRIVRVLCEAVRRFSEHETFADDVTALAFKVS